MNTFANNGYWDVILTQTGCGLNKTLNIGSIFIFDQKANLSIAICECI